jgi:hypothetical protein
MSASAICVTLILPSKMTRHRAVVCLPCSGWRKRMHFPRLFS